MDTAELVQIGDSQAIRLPAPYRLPGNRVYLKRQGIAIIVLPVDQAWQPMLNSLSEFDSDFMANKTIRHSNTSWAV